MTPDEQERVGRLVEALEKIAYLAVMSDEIPSPEQLAEQMQRIAAQAVREYAGGEP